MKCKAAIITAVKVETDSVMRLYDNWEKIFVPGDNQEYYSALFTRSGKEQRIITAQQNVMGTTAAVMLSGKLITYFRPEYIIMCGIAACIGHESENFYGDIIIPDKVWDCSSGKFTAPGKPAITFGNIGFLPRPVALSLDEAILETVRKLEGNCEFQLVIAPMACGSSVVANRAVVKRQIDSFMPETVGLDMESYGVFYAAENASYPRPKAIVIKGICDYADTSKTDKYQKFAAYNSSMFTKFLLENYL